MGEKKKKKGKLNGRIEEIPTRIQIKARFPGKETRFSSQVGHMTSVLTLDHTKILPHRKSL